MDAIVARDGPVAAPAALLGWDDPAPGEHGVQFYDDDAFLTDGLGRFIGASLGAGDAVIVIATPAHREALATRLESLGLDLARAADQGRYVSLDAAATLAQYAPDGHLDCPALADLFSGVIASAATPVTGERRGITIYGELVALLYLDGRAEAAIRLEQLWNELARRHTFSLLCGYPMSAFGREADGEPLGRICAEHTRVFPAESYAALRGEDERLLAVARLQQKAAALAAEVAERERAQRELAAQNRALVAAVAARDAFLSVAAHELKTPVTSLRAYAQLLLRDARLGRAITAERLNAALGAFERQTEKLRQLVARLLDTAQIEAGRLRIAPVPTDLVALTEEALAPYRDGTAHTLVVDGPPTLVAEVDPIRFEQVVTNLMDNAVKYSPVGGVVTVTLQRGGSGELRLSITDQGVGIPPDRREAVFARFSQAHDTGHLSGLGLGLSIAREIVALHGGTIRIEEPEQGGTRVVVVLPPSTGDAVIGP